MQKRVIAINSSKRKKTTYGLLEQIKGVLNKKGVTVDIINLFDYDIKECTGCELCLRKGKCHINDDVRALMNKLTEYDGIILSTPVYMNNVSGKLKVFVDRTCVWMHRPELVSIPLMLVVTTASSGVKRTLEYLENIGLQWGAFVTDKIYRNVKTLKNSIRIEECSDFIKHLFMPKLSYKPSITQLIQFQVQKVLAEKILPKDKEYWELKGWINKNYFFDANINFMKNFISKSFYKFLSSRIRKIEQ